MFLSFSGNMLRMNEPALKRLGHLVQSRRISRGWKTREDFADDLTFSYRVLTDLENGNRKLGKSSYREVESKLGWEAGSADRVLDGGDPVEVLSDEQFSRLRHPAHSVLVSEAINTEDPAVVDLLLRVTQGNVDEATRRDAAEMISSIQIRDFPSLFEKLSRTGKLKVVDYGHEVRRQELIEQQGESDDQQEQSPTEGSTPQAPESKKTDAGDPRVTLVPVAHEDEDDQDLAARDTGGISEGERTRRDMDQQGEAPDPEGPEDGA